MKTRKSTFVFSLCFTTFGLLMWSGLLMLRREYYFNPEVDLIPNKELVLKCNPYIPKNEQNYHFVNERIYHAKKCANEKIGSLVVCGMIGVPLMIGFLMFVFAIFYYNID